jgi:hypothetical protein
VHLFKAWPVPIRLLAEFAFEIKALVLFAGCAGGWQRVPRYISFVHLARCLTGKPL